MSDILGQASGIVMVLVAALVALFVVGAIVNKKATWKILQWVLIGLGVVLVGWVAITFKVNIGKYINRLLGKRGKMPMSILNDSGETIGKEVDIIKKKHPVRDVGVVSTSDGKQIELPKGVKDTDVERVTVVGDNDYRVELKHESLTDVFDTGSGI